MVGAIVVSIALFTCTSGDDDADAAARRVPNPTVTAATGGHGQAAGGLRDDVTQFGYQEKEYLFEGTAKTYPPAALPPAAYRSRMIVWTPMDPARFNGTTVVEWAEVSDFGQFDRDRHARPLLQPGALRPGRARPREAAQDVRRVPRRRAAHGQGRRRGQRTVAGFLGNNRLLYVENFVYNNGGRVISEDEYGDLKKPYKLTLGEPPALAALQLHHDLYNTDRAATTRPGPDFLQGTVAMQVAPTASVGTLKQRAPTLDYGRGAAAHAAELPRPPARRLVVGRGQAQHARRTRPGRCCSGSIRKENILQYVETLAAVTTHKGVIADPRARRSIRSACRSSTRCCPASRTCAPRRWCGARSRPSSSRRSTRMFAGEMTPRPFVDKIEGPVNALLAKEP